MIDAKKYLIVDDGHVWSSGKRYSGDATDIFSELRPHLQTSISREGPEHGVDQVFLQKPEQRLSLG